MRLREVWRVLLLIPLLLNTSAAFAGIAFLGQRWPQDKQRLGVCFFGGSPESRAAVARLARQWTPETSISFDFGAEPDFNSCGGERTFDIRVGFDKGGFWSYIGTDARNVPQDRPTVNLEGIVERFDPRANRVVLHQFGHVLGLLHEEQNPQAGCREELDIDKILSLGVTQQQLDKLLAPVSTNKSVLFAAKPAASPAASAQDQQQEQRTKRFLPDDGKFMSTGFDSRSVMRLFMPTSYFKAGEQSKCHGPNVDTLSEGDLKLVKLLYPRKPADVSAAEGNYLTIRLSGVLAPEHYGHILIALYEKGKLGLKKHVLLGSQTVEKVVQEERLAPRGVTALATAEFLCQVNPHVCVKAHGRNRWSNTPATKNYEADDNVACPDKSLPKFVLCLPNVRLEPYSVLYNYQFDPRQDSLRGLVVNRFEGCDSWDDKCRALVRSMNAQYDAEFTTGPELVSPKFSGTLRLPGKAYRIVIRYADEADRLAIVEAIDSVIEKRAKDLRVPKDKVFIHVTYPAGVARGHAMPGEMRLLPEKTGLKQEARWLPSFVKDTYKNWVHAGIWDLAVDTEHCLLKDVVHVTRPQNIPPPSVTTPPDSASKCGDARANGYLQSTFFDHGTGIAGILSAHHPDKAAVTGMVPGLKIWAWQVVNPVQFEGGVPDLFRYHQAFSLDPKVINVSQSYDIDQGRRSNLENLLFGEGDNSGADQTYLIVAAAGDVLEGPKRVGKEMNSTSGTECWIYPACWSNAKDEPTGLISVVGLNATEDGLLKSPDGTPLSNYGMAFDVAALGVVQTTFHGGWVGTMVGSSVAAPHVAGLATTIIAKARDKGLPFPSVQEVKDRIIFTADITDDIRGLSRYGRINPEKALGFDEDLIVSDAWATCAAPPCRTKVKIDRKEARKIQPILFKDGMMEGKTPHAEEKIVFNDIRSIRAEANNRYTVFYYDNRARRMRRLTEAVMEFASDSPFVIKDGRKTPFPKQGLKEYVSCTITKPCKE
jgi:hypothetical protein